MYPGLGTAGNESDMLFVFTMQIAQGLGAFVLPSSVISLQDKLFNDFAAVDHDVTVCAGLSTTQKTNWVAFVHSFQAWYNIDPTTFSSYWTAGTLYDQGLQFQSQLIAWQQTIKSSGCTLTEPDIVSPAPGIDWSALKTIAIAGAVLGTGFFLYPIIREATATARQIRTSSQPKATGKQIVAGHLRRTADRLENPIKVEARNWLHTNYNPYAFGVNTFQQTRNAIKYVDRLYILGATRVLVGGIYSHKGEAGPSADTLYVTLPQDPVLRNNILNFILKDYTYKPDELNRVADRKQIVSKITDSSRQITPDQLKGGQTIRLWWD